MTARIFKIFSLYSEFIRVSDFRVLFYLCQVLGSGLDLFIMEQIRYFLTFSILSWKFENTYLLVLTTLCGDSFSIYSSIINLFKFSSCSMNFGEGNGTPLQYSCLGNPVDGGAW